MREQLAEDLIGIASYATSQLRVTNSPKFEIMRIWAQARANYLERGVRWDYRSFGKSGKKHLLRLRRYKKRKNQPEHTTVCGRVVANEVHQYARLNDICRSCLTPSYRVKDHPITWRRRSTNGDYWIKLFLGDSIHWRKDWSKPESILLKRGAPISADEFWLAQFNHELIRLEMVQDMDRLEQVKFIVSLSKRRIRWK